MRTSKRVSLLSGKSSSRSRRQLGVAPQEFFRSSLYSFEVSEIKLKEYCFTSSADFEFLNRSFALDLISGGNIDLSIMLQQSLVRTAKFIRLQPLHEKERSLFTLTVSFPIPVLAPVTITTFPVRSGISLTLNVDLGGKDWLRRDRYPPMSL
jgi:hypothetical protein